MPTTTVVRTELITDSQQVRTTQQSVQQGYSSNLSAYQAPQLQPAVTPYPTQYAGYVN